MALRIRRRSLPPRGMGAVQGSTQSRLDLHATQSEGEPRISGKPDAAHHKAVLWCRSKRDRLTSNIRRSCCALPCLFLTQRALTRIMRTAATVMNTKRQFIEQAAITLRVIRDNVRPLLLGFRRRLSAVTESALLHSSFTSGNRCRS
jgi:hypothetical protein